MLYVQSWSATITFCNAEMPEMHMITLSCGRKVQVKSLYISHTYGPMIEGSFCAESNNILIECARRHIARTWGERPTAIIPPNVTIPTEPHPATPDEQYLPPNYFAAWLNSDTPLDKNLDSRYHGSELVVIWFDSLEIDTSFRNLFQEVVRTVTWEKMAGDYELD